MHLRAGELRDGRRSHLTTQAAEVGPNLAGKRAESAWSFCRKGHIVFFLFKGGRGIGLLQGSSPPPYSGRAAFRSFLEEALALTHFGILDFVRET